MSNRQQSIANSLFPQIEARPEREDHSQNQIRRNRYIGANQDSSAKILPQKKRMPIEIWPDQIHIDKEIGQGGFSKVYKGLVDGFKGPVAIKASFQKNVISTELEILTKIIADANSPINPSLPEALAYGKVMEFEYLVLPMYGRTLKDILLQATPAKRFSKATVAIIGLQLLSALKQIHDMGYLHCDLKPDNVLLKTQDTAKCREIVLIDFGLATTYLVPKQQVSIGAESTPKVSQNSNCNISPSKIISNNPSEKGQRYVNATPSMGSSLNKSGGVQSFQVVDANAVKSSLHLLNPQSAGLKTIIQNGNYHGCLSANGNASPKIIGQDRIRFGNIGTAASAEKARARVHSAAGENEINETNWQVDSAHPEKHQTRLGDKCQSKNDHEELKLAKRQAAAPHLKHSAANLICPFVEISALENMDGPTPLENVQNGPQQIINEMPAAENARSQNANSQEICGEQAFAHVTFHKVGMFCGNHIFASRRSMSCYSVSRGDDMESFFYLLMFFLNGELPWLSATAVVNRHERINFTATRKIKTQFTPDELWSSEQLMPKQLKIIADSIWGLKFEGRPDYELIQHSLKCLLIESWQNEYPQHLMLDLHQQKQQQQQPIVGTSYQGPAQLDQNGQTISFDQCKIRDEYSQMVNSIAEAKVSEQILLNATSNCAALGENFALSHFYCDWNDQPSPHQRFLLHKLQQSDCFKNTQPLNLGGVGSRAESSGLVNKVIMQQHFGGITASSRMVGSISQNNSCYTQDIRNRYMVAGGIRTFTKEDQNQIQARQVSKDSSFCYTPYQKNSAAPAGTATTATTQPSRISAATPSLNKGCFYLPSETAVATLILGGANNQLASANGQQQMVMIPEEEKGEQAENNSGSSRAVIPIDNRPADKNESVKDLHSQENFMQQQQKSMSAASQKEGIHPSIKQGSPVDNRKDNQLLKEENAHKEISDQDQEYDDEELEELDIGQEEEEVAAGEMGMHAHDEKYYATQNAHVVKAPSPLILLQSDMGSMLEQWGATRCRLVKNAYSRQEGGGDEIRNAENINRMRDSSLNNQGGLYQQHCRAYPENIKGQFSIKASSKDKQQRQNQEEEEEDIGDDILLLDERSFSYDHITQSDLEEQQAYQMRPQVSIIERYHDLHCFGAEVCGSGGDELHLEKQRPINASVILKDKAKNTNQQLDSKQMLSFANLPGNCNSFLFNQGAKSFIGGPSGKNALPVSSLVILNAESHKFSVHMGGEVLMPKKQLLPHQ